VTRIIYFLELHDIKKCLLFATNYVGYVLHINEVTTCCGRCVQSAVRNGAATANREMDQIGRCLGGRD